MFYCFLGGEKVELWQAAASVLLRRRRHGGAKYTTCVCVYVCGYTTQLHYMRMVFRLDLEKPKEGLDRDRDAAWCPMDDRGSKY